MVRFHSTLPHRRGVASLWLVLTLVGLVAMVGLGIDTVYGVWGAQQLQAAADAAALAGAQRVRLQIDQTRTLAMAVAADNDVAKHPVLLNENPDNAVDGDIVIGVFDRSAHSFTPTTVNPNAVQVFARRTVDSLNGSLPLMFGPIFGINTIEVTRQAIAMVDGYEAAGLVVLDPDSPSALDLQGTPSRLTVNGGSVYVNSDSVRAATHSGQPTLYAPEVNIAGETDNGFESSVNMNGDLNEHRYPVLDPLRNLPAPSYNPASNLGTVKVTGSTTGAQTLQPGYYSGGISMRNNNGTLNLAPGIYVLGGAGLDIRGGNFIANECLFYIVDGPLYLGGNGQIIITPPTTGTYQGISVFQARGNTDDSTIIGTGNMNVDGTLYFPDAHLDIGGTGDGISNQIIAWTLRVFGTSDLTINYNGNFPSPANKVFLVH